MKTNIILCRNLGLQNWLKIFHNMHDFTKLRSFHTCDEIWFVEHYPIFTQGYLRKKDNIINSYNIPFITTDRGGQITYHGPGQQIIYFLIDLKRRKMSIRELIDIMQTIVLRTLKKCFIIGYLKKESPGVYVNKKKICSIGLKIKNGYTFHGMSLNIDMDLKPFDDIHPCGDKTIKMTQIKDCTNNIYLKKVQIFLIQALSQYFEINIINFNFNCT